MRATPTPGLRIIRQADDGTVVVRLEGELDLAEAENLEDELAEAERSDAVRIVLDLSELRFIDSTGIALLVAATQRSSRDSDRLRLKRADSRQVERILMVTGIADRLPFLD